MEPAVSSDRLAAISTNTWFVLGAYLFAFFPWAILSNANFITEKWRTVRHTHYLARYHMVYSIVTMMYVGVYAEAQRRAGDTKELGAALAALLLYFIHLVRAVRGLALLNAFVAWCKEALECLRAMKWDDEDGAWRGNDNESDGFNIDDQEEIPLEKILLVNNTVVAIDVGVNVSWRKAWAGVKRWEFKPSTWLMAENSSLSMARWTAMFLCGMANDWRGEEYMFCSKAGEALTCFFSRDMYLPLNFLWNVTCSVEDSGKSTIVSIGEINDAISRGAAYGFQSYNSEMDRLVSSYPIRNGNHLLTNNRDVLLAGLSDSVVLAKHLGVEKLSAMRRYFDRYRLTSNGIWRKAWYLLLEQGDYTRSDNSALSRMFLDLEQIPFPYQLQMVALWDECTNWRVLQASAHADILSSLEYARLESWNLFEMETRTANVFEHCRSMAISSNGPRVSMLGVSMESVRTFLAECLISAPDAVDWEPLISEEGFDFSVSSRLTQNSPYLMDERMVWECQRALQSKLSETSTAHRNFASNAELMMLLILSMPSLRVEEENEEGEVVYSTEESRVSGTGSSVSRLGRAHSSFDLSVCVWRAWSTVEPQDVKVIIRIDSESEMASLRLQCGAPGTRFKWEDWVNTAMGMMKGYDEANEKEPGKKGASERLFRKVDLRESVVELCPLYWDGDDLVVATGAVGIWMGWRVFDTRICKFEMEQWMRACDIDIKYIDDDSVEEKEVWHAEDVIRQVVKSSDFDVDGEA